MLRISRPWLAALCFGVVAVIAGNPAGAADTGNGSKNFRTPTTVPNFFSNEAGPMIGGAAESQRGQLYSSQTASSGPAAAPQSAPTYAAAPQTRQHVAMAVPHGRAYRGRGAPVAAHHVTVHGRVVYRASTRGAGAYRVASHSGGSHYSVHAVSASHAVGHSPHVTSTHRHARG